MPGALGGSLGGGRFLVGEEPLYETGMAIFFGDGLVAIEGMVGLALKVHLTQARGTFSMEPQVYARQTRRQYCTINVFGGYGATKRRYFEDALLPKKATGVPRS